MERNNKLTPLSQQLRKRMTREESLLWHCFLKRYALRFHRQYVIGNYIVDFYCHQARLVVEIDGGQHTRSSEVEKDIVRTQYLEAQGLRVLRFTNLEVKQQFYAVCSEIDAAANPFPRGEGARRADEECGK
jgi:very-short-patch-repair endonuclease